MFCLIRLHIAALRCKQQFCIQYVAGGIKELQILPTCTSHVWHTCCGQFIHLACWTFSEWCSSCLVEDAGCGVFLHALFSSCGHSLWKHGWGTQTEPSDGAGQSCARFSGSPDFIASFLTTYAAQHTHTVSCDPEKEKSGTLHQGWKPAGLCPAAALSCCQDTSAGDTRLGSWVRRDAAPPRRSCGGLLEGERSLCLPPHQLALTWADGKGLLSDFLSVLDLWR